MSGKVKGYDMVPPTPIYLYPYPYPFAFPRPPAVWSNLAQLLRVSGKQIQKETAFHIPVIANPRCSDEIWNRQLSAARSQVCHRGCVDESGRGGQDWGVQFKLFISRFAKRKFLERMNRREHDKISMMIIHG